MGLVGYRSICRSRNSSDAPSSSTATSSLRRSVPSWPVQVVVTGTLVTRTWIGEDGSERRKLEVTVDELGASLLFRDLQIER